MTTSAPKPGNEFNDPKFYGSGSVPLSTVKKPPMLPLTPAEKAKFVPATNVTNLIPNTTMSIFSAFNMTQTSYSPEGMYFHPKAVVDPLSYPTPVRTVDHSTGKVGPGSLEGSCFEVKNTAPQDPYYDNRQSPRPKWF